jgi:predicted ABC-type ATPase
MANKPIIYILAGPNGIGKTTANPFFIPLGIPYINADDFAKQFRERLGHQTNVQELANAAAIEYMNDFLNQNQSFAIETNLADEDTWRFLMGVQKLGYFVQLHFFNTSDVQICIDRVENRFLHGGHYVRPDIVKMRYDLGLKLLRFYKNIPDRLFLTDNTLGMGELCMEMQRGSIVFQMETLPSWIQFVLNEPDTFKKNYSSIDEIREKYRLMNRKKEDENQD